MQVPSLKIQDIRLNGVLPALLFLDNFIPTATPVLTSEERALVLERAFEVRAISSFS